MPVNEKKIKKRTVVGVVTSDKMDKTITVKSERTVKHKKYGKFIRKFTIYKAHDEKNEAKTGDKIEITGTRPISRTKFWKLVKVLN